MSLAIIGMGPGNPDLLTAQARAEIETGGTLFGSARLLEPYRASNKNCIETVSPAEIVRRYAELPEGARACVLVSGDVGFYSLARSFSRMLEGEDLRLIPGISSLQYFCARLGMPWDGAAVVSLHGREQDLLGTAAQNERTFVLTGGEHSVSAICRTLAENGFGELLVQVGERLSYPDERITRGEARVLARQEFDPLAVLLIHNGMARRLERPVTHGLPDERFLRGDVPMTKSEVRAVSIAKLGLRKGMTVWDIGAGTGSVCVEIARVLPDGLVFAVEKDADALALLEQNKMRFGVKNLRIVEGRAPDALKNLPKPDAVFVGGCGGALTPSLLAALDKNPEVRIVINAITLETVGAALDCFNRLCLCDKDIVQVGVAKAKTVGGNHMMLAQNPIFILSAGGGKPTDA